MVEEVAVTPTPVQPKIAVPLSEKLTCPVSFNEPDGAGMLAVKVTAWLTTDVFPGDEDESVMLDVAAPTVCVKTGLFVLPLKLGSLP